MILFYHRDKNYREPLVASGIEARRTEMSHRDADHPITKRFKPNVGVTQKPPRIVSKNYVERSRAVNPLFVSVALSAL
jgi:hypothetical protein